MPSVESVILSVCNGPQSAVWLRVLRDALLQTLGARLATRIEGSSGRWLVPDSDVHLIDAPLLRHAWAVGEGLPSLEMAVGFELGQIQGPQRSRFLDSVNSSLDPKHPQKWSGLRKKLLRVLSALLQDKRAETILRRSIVPDIWRVVADLIAIDAVAIGKPHDVAASLSLHNRLLTVAELRYTRSPTMRSLKGHLDLCSDGILGLRGNLVRLVEEIGLSGVREPGPAIGPALKPLSMRSPRTAWIKTLNGSIAEVLAFKGVASVILDQSAPAPEPLPPGLKFRDLREARRNTYHQYDLTVLAYQLLSAIEQLIRGWAVALGQDVLSAQGRPKSINDIVRGWPAAAPLMPALRQIYSETHRTMRGKFVHGGLLSVDTERQYLMTHMVARSGLHPLPISGIHPFSPENTCSVALELLRTLCQAISSSRISLAPKDFQWAALLLPPQAEVLTDAVRSRQKMTWPELRRWNLTRDVLSALTPGVTQFATIGLIGQLDRKTPNVVERYLSGLLVFETLFRLVAQMHGVDVLQVVNRGSGNLDVQYKMLDEQQLLAPENLGPVLDGVAAVRRADAERWLKLTTVSRNAVVHGAILDYSGDLADAMAYWLSRAVEVLTESAMNLMTREAAYFRWRQRLKDGIEAGPEDDWRRAESQISDLIRSQLRKRRIGR